MQIQPLLLDITDQLKEAQIKLGFGPSTVKLYYNPASLSMLTGAEAANVPAMAAALSAEPAFSASPLGQLIFAPHDDRVEITIPQDGVRYVHEQVEASPFLQALIGLFAGHHHASMEEVAAWLEENKLKAQAWFTVDDLVYLKRGGRVSAATALVGTMLNIKPVLHMDNEGHLISMVKARGRKAAISTLVSKMQELGGGWDNRTVFICHADCRDDAERLAALAKEKCGVEEAFIGNLGAVIGSHAGPGTLSLFFMGKEK